MWIDSSAKMIVYDSPFLLVRECSRMSDDLQGPLNHDKTPIARLTNVSSMASSQCHILENKDYSLPRSHWQPFRL